MDIRLHSSLEAIEPAAWNRLAGTANPFLRHEFLVALERHHCVGRQWGWLPCHFTVQEGTALVAAAPGYVKSNSYGELVFDWAWADAYHRHGLDYYPKLIIAVPYTPVSGRRLLVDEDHPLHSTAAALLIEAATALCKERGYSSLHWLFADDHDIEALARAGMVRRMGCQYHWHNEGYRSFEDFLQNLSARHRKKLRRERRKIHEAGATVAVHRGDELTEAEWSVVHGLYRSTFERLGGIPTLSLGFFNEIARTMAGHVVVVLARRHGKIIAAAFNMRGGGTLYGRHWGCRERVDGLHFEVCYYQGVEYCIEQGLQRFDPGAQGEYKVSRGFLPTRTWSAHWLAHPGFRQAVARYVVQEAEGVAEFMAAMDRHLPYRLGRTTRLYDRGAS